MPVFNLRKPRDCLPVRFEFEAEVGLQPGEIVGGQPTIAAVGSSLAWTPVLSILWMHKADACIGHFKADASVRTAITIAPVKGQGAAKYAIYFGDLKANVYGVDALNGKLIWKVKVDDQPVARIAANRYEDRLCSSIVLEERAAPGTSPTYPCCTFRGSVSVGRQHRRLSLEKLSFGRAQAHENYGCRCTAMGPGRWRSGIRQRSIPLPCTLRRYGRCLYREPATVQNTDSVVANMDNGKPLWASQDTRTSVWLAGCGPANKSGFTRRISALIMILARHRSRRTLPVDAESWSPGKKRRYWALRS